VHRCLLALTLALAALPAAALEGDPRSSACRQALVALQARESELAASVPDQARPRTAADTRWRSLRAQAARACLGRESDAEPAPLPRSALPPIAVPPTSAPTPVTPPAIARPPLAPPPPAVLSRPAPVLRSCDALGCWTSDGARLPHTGRDPLDPRVRCTLQGRVVVCL